MVTTVTGICEFRNVEAITGVTGVTLAYPSLGTLADYRCTGPGTSGSAAELSPRTPLKHNKEEESTESQ